VKASRQPPVNGRFDNRMKANLARFIIVVAYVAAMALTLGAGTRW
jgi:hypothetical protein